MITLQVRNLLLIWSISYETIQNNTGHKRGGKLMEESYTVWVKDKCVSIGFMSYEDAVYLSDWHRNNGVADEDIEIEDTGGME